MIAERLWSIKWRMTWRGMYACPESALILWSVTNIMSSSRNLLAMALKGGGVMSSKYLMSDGDGPVLVFKSLLTTPKWLCLSQRFREEAPGLANIIIAVVRAQQPPRLWKIHSFASLQVGCWVLLLCQFKWFTRPNPFKPMQWPRKSGGINPTRLPDLYALSGLRRMRCLIRCLAS